MQEVELKEIDPKLKAYLKTYQEFLVVLNKYYTKEESFGEFHIRSEKAFFRMSEEIEKFRGFEFAKTLFKTIDAVSTRKKDVEQHRETLKSMKMSDTLSKAADVWQSKNIDTILSFSKQVAKYADTKKASQQEILSKYDKSNPYIKPLNVLGGIGHTGLMASISLEDINKVMGTDLDKFMYSYLNIPKSKAGDNEYLVYYILNLKDSDEPVKIEKDWHIYLTMKYGDDDKYQELKGLVGKYLNGNDRKALGSAMKMLKDFPDILQMNNKLKANVSEVYRGVSGTLSIDTVKQWESENRYVATSTSEYIARKFALGINLLSSENDRNQDKSVVLTYSVKPDDIVLVTAVFGGAFSENEVVIDVTGAELVSHKFI